MAVIRLSAASATKDSALTLLRSTVMSRVSFVNDGESPRDPSRNCEDWLEGVSRREELLWTEFGVGPWEEGGKSPDSKLQCDESMRSTSISPEWVDTMSCCISENESSWELVSSIFWPR